MLAENSPDSFEKERWLKRCAQERGAVRQQLPKGTSEKLRFKPKHSVHLVPPVPTLPHLSQKLLSLRGF